MPDKTFVVSFTDLGLSLPLPFVFSVALLNNASETVSGGNLPSFNSRERESFC